jgi:hypothetical protein
MVSLSQKMVDYYCKFTYILRVDERILHDRKLLKDDTIDILDVPKSNQRSTKLN